MNSSVIDVNDIDLDSIDYKSDPLQIKDIAKMLQGDNQKLIEDNELAVSESLLRGKALNLIAIRAISSFSMTVSIITTAFWVYEQVARVWGDPIRGVYVDDF